MSLNLRLHRTLVVLACLSLLAACVPTPAAVPTTVPPSPSPMENAKDLNELKAELVMPAATARLEAAYELGELGQAATPAILDLIAATADPDVQVQVVAAYALGKIAVPTESVVPALADIVKDTNKAGDVRYSAARALGHIGPAAQAAIPALLEAIQGGDENVRFAAAEALAQIGASGDAVPILIEALDDPNWYVRRGAAAALHTAETAAIPALIERLKNARWGMRNAIVNVLSEMSDAAIPQLADRLKTGNLGQVKALAAIALIRMGPRAESALQEASASPNAQTKMIAIAALGFTDEGSLPMLMDALRAADPRVSKRAAEAIARIGPAAAKPLADILNTEGVTAPTSVADALQQLGADAVPFILPLLDDQSNAVRLRAVKVLGAIGAPAAPATPQLIKMLRDTEHEATVQAAVTIALGQIHQAPADVIPALVDNIKKPLTDSAVKSATLQALQQWGPDAAAAAPTLIDFLRDGSSDLRGAAVAALGAIGSGKTEVIEALVAMLTDPHQESEIRVGAADALGRMAGSASAAVPALKAALSDTVLSDADPAVSSQAATALAAIGLGGEDPTSLLVELLAHPSPIVRLGVIQALQDAGPSAPDSVYLLVALLEDPDPEVRLEAARTLRDFGVAARDATPFLIALLREPDLLPSEEISKTLISITDPASVLPFLATALQSENAETRCAAAWSLDLLGAKAEPIAPLLISVLRKPENKAIDCTEPASPSTTTKLHRILIGTLAKLGPSAVSALPELVQALHDEDLRRSVAEGLGAIGPDAVPALLQLLRSTSDFNTPGLAEALEGKDNDVRRSAVYAIGLNPSSAKAAAEDLLAIASSDSENRSIRKMAAAARENSGRDMSGVWSSLGETSPLAEICPVWADMEVKGGKPYDLYDQVCPYEPAPPAPDWPSIIRAINRIVHSW